MNQDIIEITEIDNITSSCIPEKSSNFGSGIELLMNEKQKYKQENNDDNIGIEDLEHLENELNDLSDVNSINDPFMNNISFNEKKINLQPENLNVRFEEKINLGKSTASLENEQKTWDGYGKFNEIPTNIENQIPSTPSMNKEELLREKLKYLRKLETLEKKGVELTKKYTMDDSLLEMQGEYEMIIEEKSKQNAVKFQGNMLMACINGIEFLNNRFDPFDIKLDGWGEQVNENINDYDEIFGELHDKYQSKASLAPELKLLFQLGGSAMMVHMTNTLFKTSMPGMDDILRQNPDLMKSFQTAAVNTMGQNNPGFGGFMSNMMNSNSQGPPPSINTQGSNAINTPLNRPGNNEFNSKSNNGDAFSSVRQRSNRPEMNGPSDIDGILSGLKTKTINIQDSPVASNPQTAESSTISINDLKDLETNGKIPNKSKRRSKTNPRSNKNIISLDL
jgi:hypothetical protein